jgi:hypothetical protein
VRDPGIAAGLEALRSLPHRRDLTITLEQYLLAACLGHHRGRAGSPYRDVRIAYLFPSWAAAADAERAAALGFTHLIADTKRDPDAMRRIERRVRTDHPEQFERCAALVDGGRAVGLVA